MYRPIAVNRQVAMLSQKKPRDASCLSVYSFSYNSSSAIFCYYSYLRCTCISSLRRGSLSSMLVVINKDLLMRGGLCGKLHGRRHICCSHSLYTSHRSIASYSSRIAIFSPAIESSLRGCPSEYRHMIWCAKTRMV